MEKVWKKGIMLLLLIISSHAMFSQENDTIINREIEVQAEPISIIDNFSRNDWETVNIQGKLKMKGLPLSPGLKIFMTKDSLIDISVRAPFVGEAVRIEITSDSVTAVNKMNKTYIKESIGEYTRFYPGALSNIQDLLLGQFFIPGVDMDEVALEEVVEVFDEGGQHNVVPKPVAELEGLKYGYVVDDYFRPILLVAIPQSRQNLEFDVIYEYDLKGYNINMALMNGESGYDAALEMKAPEWETEAPKAIDLNKKFRQVSVQEFVQNIGK